MNTRSRKLWLTVFICLLIVGVGLIGAGWASFAPMVETIVGSLVGCLAIFSGSNVSQKWLLSKTGKTVESTIYGKGGSIFEPGQPTEGKAD